ncbi:serine/arginine repetitive matrix protein 2 isoform X2 [Cephus cinctus]|uniref:Serine/arginine repetitive matrix protein 2 isoform X2 n=1 Tax=Cephus cinctus TaxID=211228 RepID=A0AAJ7FL30_CEPCN|nr:serine/arginine repetitive matrix protein 2 isoform X2 [Cephus cinctus]
MEAGFLNFHDEEHFSDFSLPLDQHNLLEESQGSLMEMVHDEYGYIENRIDTSAGLWGTEQELNGDIAVLPVSGVASVIPKMEHTKEDFAKVLTDWQEHIGYLQASDMEEDIDVKDMVSLTMSTPEKMSTDLPKNIFQDEPSSRNSQRSPSGKRSKPNDIKHPRSKVIRMSESEQSDKDIDVVGLDSVDEIDPDIDLTNINCERANSLCDDFDYDDLGGAVKNGTFDLASYIAEDDDKAEKTVSAIGRDPNSTSEKQLKRNIVNEETKKDQQLKLKTGGITSKLPKKQRKAVKHKLETESEDCIDVETVSEQVPVLEAGDVKSLLEQFEASEAVTNFTLSSSNGRLVTGSDLRLYSNKGRPTLEKLQLTPIKKPAEAQDSTLHQNIRDSLPKEIIDRIKASGRKKIISVIPAIPNTKSGTRSSGTRMQDAAATLSRNKLLKIVANSPNASGRIDGSVQLDHDYCSSASSAISSSDSNSEYDRQSSDSEKTSPIKDDGSRQSDYYIMYTKNMEHARSVGRKNNTRRCGGERWTDNSSKKDSGLESGDVSDASEEQTMTEAKVKGTAMDHARDQLKECQLKQTNSKTVNTVNSVNSVVSVNISNASNKSANKPTPVYEMKIRSALATSILQLRKGVLTKTKSVDGGGHKVKQMVSVLKKPPNVSQPLILSSNLNESIVTTTNSLNNKVQNIILQDISSEITSEDTKRPPRKKLNLAEYRSRREQNRSDSSRTSSPVQPMTLVYIHHVSTTTEPIKDDPENPVWSEREIVSILKPKSEVEEEKVKPKPPTREIAIQTNETVFDCPSRTSENTDENDAQKKVSQMKDRKQRRYRQHRVTSSSSRSRSRSRSKSRSRSRSRSKSRSRSRRRSNNRRRRISHRRSSVSSSSSWSSRSRSHTRSTSSSRSRSSRSRSRSSRSRSRSSSRYSSCSRSSSRSNFGRSKWSGHRRGERRERRRSYDRHRRRSSRSSHGYRDWRRSPPNSYRRPYDGWYDREKQRQVEERRVIYVGRLDEGITKAELRRRFEVFGPVVDISVHFREHGDNYGFVTFAYKNDAYEAVEHGNDDPSQPRYDLCFGGRRAFCKVKYADLDGIASNSLGGGSRGMLKADEDNTFDLLLKEAQAKLRKRKV